MLERLDKLLIQRNLVSSRTRAEEIIRTHGVLVDGKLINKTGKKFPVDCEIKMIEEEIPWVSRGALKLLASLEEWNPKIKGGTFMDIGASTGGFTEVLIENGAKKVFCVDVGSDQLHQKLKLREEVINLEKMHVRELNSRIIDEPIDGCVIDVSFISVKKVFPFIHSFLKEGGFVIALVKPQFEVGKDNVGKGGIVKNKSLYPIVLKDVAAEAQKNNLMSIGSIESPVLGGDGNMEFLMLLKKD
jgi:23S rRNA (cytidine1920-2'-O)/16S rRNA (cytidine1409-2'-O)-methyltransferase